MSIFELAARQKLRFSTNKGDLTTEQIWDLPLQSKSGFDLDTLAKSVNGELRGVAEESFVATSTNPAKPELELKMAVIKHVIATRLAENDAARKRLDRASERAKLINILADKQEEALKSLTPDEIQKRLAELEA